MKVHRLGKSDGRGKPYYPYFFNPGDSRCFSGFTVSLRKPKCHLWKGLIDGRFSM